MGCRGFLLFEDAVEFAGDGLAHFAGRPCLMPKAQALSGAEGAGDHFHGLGQLGGESFKPFLSPQQDPQRGQKLP